MYLYWPKGKNNTKQRNFGDAINPYIGKFFSGEEVINVNGNEKIAKRRRPFLACGSNLHFVKVRTEVWGSGVLSNRNRLKANPKKVYAVRGPKTRQWLKRQNVECPPIYGDPGLLCPMMFDTNAEQKYPLGVIPHVVDKAIVDKWETPDSVRIIDIMGDFQDVIDSVNECRFIISSSLHGLILADAYKIPSLWVTIGGRPTEKGKAFKFYDYLLSVGADLYEPYYLSEQGLHNVRKLIRMCRGYEIRIDLKTLVDVCPFNFEGRKWNEDFRLRK